MGRPMAGAAAPVDGLRVAAYRVPTEATESDGTLTWDATTIVVVEVRGGGAWGLGYTYGSRAVVALVADDLAGVVCGSDAGATARTWEAMSARLRNVGRRGAGMMAIAAVDVALWDLHARLLDVPLCALLGGAGASMPVYGSGGFTSAGPGAVAQQLGAWAAAGIPRVKMKVGRSPADDPARLDAARDAIGDAVELFVDANGAFTPGPARAWAHRYRDEWDVRWFEEPVSSDDVDGLRFVRAAAPPGLDVAAGEYGAVVGDFHALLDAGAVDCLQIDVTRCGGITGLQAVLGAAAAHHVDVSAHCAPGVSAHAFAGARHLRHLEWFHDHVRVESLLFDGVLAPHDGALHPGRDAPGLGLTLKRADAEAYLVEEHR